MKTTRDISSYLETHFEIVKHLTQTADFSGSLSNMRRESQGIGGLYELAEDLTNEFEKLHKDKFWDGDFFDIMDEFLKEKERSK